MNYRVRWIFLGVTMRDGKPREGWRMHPHVGQYFDLNIMGSLEHR
jgi:hypothetical protein